MVFDGLPSVRFTAQALQDYARTTDLPAGAISWEKAANHGQALSSIVLGLRQCGRVALARHGRFCRVSPCRCCVCVYDGGSPRASKSIFGAK